MIFEKSLNLTCGMTFQKSLVVFAFMKLRVDVKIGYHLQLSVERLSSMKKYVFGLGSTQVTEIIHFQVIMFFLVRITLF